MYKIPKVNLKWDSLYVYYLHSFKHLCGLFLSTDLKIELFLRWEICCLSMHHDTSIEGRETIAWHFLAANRSPLLWYTVVFLYYYIILLYYYLYSKMNKGKSEALQNKRKKFKFTTKFTIYRLPPPPPRPRKVLIKILKSLLLMAELLSLSLCLCCMSARPLMTEMVPFYM